jgi:hypothetical protein
MELSKVNRKHQTNSHPTYQPRKGNNEMKNRKNITDKLIADCTPNKSFYIGEYTTWIQAIIENLEKSIGKPLTEKQLHRVFETI